MARWLIVIGVIIVSVLGYLLYTGNKTTFSPLDNLIPDIRVKANTNPTLTALQSLVGTPLMQGIDLAADTSNAAVAAIAENVAYNLTNDTVPSAPIVEAPPTPGTTCHWVVDMGWRAANSLGDAEQYAAGQHLECG